MVLCVAVVILGMTALIQMQAVPTASADEPASKPSEDAVSLPKSVDLRPNLEKWGLPTRLQGKRDTCSVFVVSSAMEYALAKETGKGTRLSIEYLNWTANKATNTNEDGSNFFDLLEGYGKYGVCAEADMPYHDSFDPKLEPSKEAIERGKVIGSIPLQLNWIKDWDGSKGVDEKQLNEIKATLHRGWPVCGGFLWPKKVVFENDLLKIVPRPEVIDGHSVLIVGYRDDEKYPGGGVLLFRNTAGEFRDSMLTYEYAFTYMNDAVWIGKTPAFEKQKGAKAAGEEIAPPDPKTLAGAGTAIFRDPLGSLSAPPAGRNRRVSSNQQPQWNDGNNDMTWLQPGESVVMPLLEGPGYINHIWLTSHAGFVGELNALSIRIYWDGRKEPGVEAPLGDFFACGTKPATVESLPVQVSEKGSLSCYWRMPFAKSAKIVVTNDNPDRGAGLYWQVDWVQVDQLPPETGYFHAKYRQEYPAKLGRDYQIADIAGRGQYVGTVFTATNAQNGWFGEGDDFFYIDGEKTPSLQGTGSEDYFNSAWGLVPRTSHWFGSPRVQGYAAGDCDVLYRWHVLDSVQFQKSLQVSIEHKGNEDVDIDGFYVERPDFISSVAFWYQVGEPKKFGGLPSWNERRVPWFKQNLVKTFLKAEATNSVKVKVDTQGFFGARPVLVWPNQAKGAKLMLPITVPEDGRYVVHLTGVKGPQFGLYKVYFDNQAIGAVNFYVPSITEDENSELESSLGMHELAQGDHVLTFEAVSLPEVNEKEEANQLAVEMLQMLKLPPKAVREVKNDNEAHFIRLGIGRSLYAYRLAYGELPDSLETLVKSGIMPERYLRDENDIPLKATRDPDAMNVESTGPTGWKHRWTGLDPRR
jgi:hypothetical protein